MNLFVLDKDPVKAAQLQCDKHIVKMIVESAQMLSTTHRIVDGNLEHRKSVSGKRTVKYYCHPNSNMEKVLYRAVHFGHPCTIWTMKSVQNYMWHYEHWVALCKEYEYRYGKEHSSFLLLEDILSSPPRKQYNVGLTPFALAMTNNPECMFEGDPVKSYQAFYQTKQERFKMTWSKRPVPSWFKEAA